MIDTAKRGRESERERARETGARKIKATPLKTVCDVPLKLLSISVACAVSLGFSRMAPLCATTAQCAIAPGSMGEGERKKGGVRLGCENMCCVKTCVALKHVLR